MSADLFGDRSRAPRRQLMHVRDAGSFADGRKCIHFECRNCGHDDGWTLQTESNSAAKRGRPCPICNETKEPACG